MSVVAVRVCGAQGVLNTDRGLGVGEEQRRTIEERARAVEAGNPTKAPLRSPLMNGRWALQYTTNQSAVGAGLLPGLRPKGPVYQTVDVFSMKVGVPPDVNSINKNTG